MKAFLLKYKWAIIYWIAYLAFLSFLDPQRDYYLDNDIETFKQTYFTQTLLWIGIVTSITIFFLVLVKSKSLKKSTIVFFSAGVTIAFFLFIFQGIFLKFSLFLNREFKRGSFQRTYVASYQFGTDQVAENFFPYDLSTQHVTTDKRLINKIYSAGLKQNDTIKVTFDKGLFGIAFQSKPFVDK